MKITNVVRHLAVAETTILKNTKKIKTHRLNPRFSRSNNLRSFAPLFRFPKNKKKKRTKEKKERKLRLPADRKCRYQTRTICGGITGHTRDGLVPDCFFSFISIERRRKKTKTTREIKETNTQKPKTIGNRGASPVTRREEESFDFLFFTFFPISAKSEMLFYLFFFFLTKCFRKNTQTIEFHAIFSASFP